MLLALVMTVLTSLVPQHAGMPGMHFDQGAVVHQFTVERDGGKIAINVRSRKDTATLQAVRMHLRHIASAFAKGDFADSIATHAGTPAGVEKMTQLKDRILYEYAETRDGGRVSIRTADPAALDAVHAFLRYQIKEHKTGAGPQSAGGWF
jgi:hypothetical protein